MMAPFEQELALESFGSFSRTVRRSRGPANPISAPADVADHSEAR
jgi:hypothetical protein